MKSTSVVSPGWRMPERPTVAAPMEVSVKTLKVTREHPPTLMGETPTLATSTN